MLQSRSEGFGCPVTTDPSAPLDPQSDSVPCTSLTEHGLRVRIAAVRLTGLWWIRMRCSTLLQAPLQLTKLPLKLADFISDCGDPGLRFRWCRYLAAGQSVD